jgi:hypothetical protein
MITLPSDLNQGTEVTINTTTKTIQLNIAGNLTISGVTLQALYSFLKDEWKSDDNLIKSLFPMVAITEDRYEFMYGWTPYDNDTRKLIRSSGWNEYDDSGVLTASFMGLITLGTIDATAQPYYQHEIDGTIVDTCCPGQVNQPIQIYGDINNGDFTYTDYLKVYDRTQGKTFTESSMADIGVTLIQYKSYTLLLSHIDDLKISESDSTISTTLPYTGITVTYYDTAVQRTIDGVDYDFSIIINGNNATPEQIYEKIQYLLRLDTNINETGTSVIGKTAALLLTFTGDNLAASTGVYIDNYPTSELSRLSVYDNTGTLRTFPIVSVFTINGLITGSQVSIYDNEIVDYANNNTLLAETDSSSTTFEYIHDGTTNDIVIIIAKVGYVELKVKVTLGISNQSIIATQEIDINL